MANQKASVQAGLKLTAQPPRGVRANLARTYASMLEEPFEAGPPQNLAAWKRLLFSLSFFHAVVQARSNTGSTSVQGHTGTAP